MAILYDPQSDRFREYRNGRITPGDWGSQALPLRTVFLVDQLLEVFPEDITYDTYVLFWPSDRIVDVRHKCAVEVPFKRLLGPL